MSVDEIRPALFDYIKSAPDGGFEIWHGLDRPLALDALSTRQRGKIQSGLICAYSGQPLAAITAIERAMRLDPAWSQQYLHFLGTAYLLAGKYETAAALLRQRVLLVPGTDLTRAILASALGHLGEIDEARRVWRELKEINPKYSFRKHFSRQPFKREEDVQRIAEGLAKARLPT